MIAKVELDSLSVEFAHCAGGFPTTMEIINQHGEKTQILHNTSPCLYINLGDGRIGRPFIPEGFEVSLSEAGGARHLLFCKIPWIDDVGNILKDFYLSMDYEFWPDGTVFVDTFFMVESSSNPDVGGFKLEFPLDLSGFDNVKWGFMPRAMGDAANAIIAVKPERFVEPGQNREFPGVTVPIFNFNCTRDGGNGAHLEFFVEGQSSLSGKAGEVDSNLFWVAGNPVVSWDFQTRRCDCRHRPWQWRNQWGFLIEPSPAKRHYPPLKMYHYFDNIDRYPEDIHIDKIAAAGTDLLILHENWRLDPQNGGIPYDMEEFKRVVDRAHGYGIRIAVYIRGNENSVTEGDCYWFDNLLRKEFDGLYMDYGSPFCELTSGDEMFPGGRMHLRRHYMKLLSLRKRVGKDGILISHTGPVFSAIGMTGGKIDSYISGEGEHGMMVRDRETHQDYSEALAVVGSFGPAAFPVYSTSRMIPFLAAAGQSPQTPLGTQFSSSSLAHPRAPGINDLHLRPLSKLWGLLKGQCDLTIFTDYNSRKVFEHDRNTGAYLAITEDLRFALLILINFAEDTRTLQCQVDWGRTPFNPAIGGLNVFKLSPTDIGPGVPMQCNSCSNFKTNVPGLGILGYLFAAPSPATDSLLKTYAAPYPAVDNVDRAYMEKVENQKRLRELPEPMPRLYLRVGIPDLAVSYEDSIWYDLFNNELQLGCFLPGDCFEPLGWIGLDGLCETKVPKGKYIQPGLESEWIALHEVLKPGEWNLGIKSLHRGEPFYSFVQATLSPEPDAKAAAAYQLRFYNQIENDRAFINWKVKIT